MLKLDIDSTSIGGRQAFATTLVENLHGEQIEHDVEEGLKKCDIYVILLGNKYSEWTENEFKVAWSSGIPIKAYIVQAPNNNNVRDARKQRSFIELLQTRVRLEGKNNPYGRHPRQFDKLSNDIINDLASIVLRGFHQDVEIRRIIKR